MNTFCSDTVSCNVWDVLKYSRHVLPKLFLLQDGFRVQRGETRAPAGQRCANIGCQGPRLLRCAREKLCNRDSDLTLAPDQW